MASTPDVAWLELCHGLWFVAVAEVQPEADWVSCCGLLDALEWRAADQVSADEFTSLFRAWRASSAEAADRPLGLRVEEAAVNVSSAKFCSELARRQIDTRLLTLMFGLVVHERNKVFISRVAGTLNDQAGLGVDGVLLSLRLAEKAFFNLDTAGRGYITLDQALYLALAKRLSRNEGHSQRESFTVGDVIKESVVELQKFGANGFYRGIVTLERFKRVSLGTATNDKELLKIIASLNHLREKRFVCSPAAELKGTVSEWEYAVRCELGSRTDAIALARFLSLRGAQVRFACFVKNQVWDVRIECSALWHAFTGGKEVEQTSDLFHMLERVLKKHVAVLNDFCTALFPGACRIDSALQTSSDNESSRLDNAGNVEDEFDESSFQDVEEIPSDDFTLDELDPILQKLEDSLQDQQISSPMYSPGIQVDGALYIEAYKLFQDERRKKGLTNTQIAQEWQQSSTDQKKVYQNLAYNAGSKLRLVPKHAEYLVAANLVTSGANADDLKTLDWQAASIDHNIEALVSKHILGKKNVGLEDRHLSSKMMPGMEQLPALFDAIACAQPDNVLKRGELTLMMGVGSLAPNQTFELLDSAKLVIPGQDFSVDLRGAEIGSTFDGNSDCFVVVPANQTEVFTFRAESREEQDEWIADIEFAIMVAEQGAKYNPTAHPAAKVSPSQPEKTQSKDQQKPFSTAQDDSAPQINIVQVRSSGKVLPPVKVPEPDADDKRLEELEKVASVLRKVAQNIKDG